MTRNVDENELFPVSTGTLFSNKWPPFFHLILSERLTARGPGSEKFKFKGASANEITSLSHIWGKTYIRRGENVVKSICTLVANTFIGSCTRGVKLT